MTTHQPTASAGPITTSWIAAQRNRNLLLAIGRGLIGLLGASGVAGASYFTFFADPAEGGVANVLDVMVGLWKIGIALTMLGVALLPRMAAESRLRLALAALAMDLAFSMVKLLGYGEQTAWTFMLMVLIGALPWLIVLWRSQRQVTTRCD